MEDPIGYFLRWVTYSTWLPGDSRGCVEYRRGWQLPDAVLELEAAAIMSENSCRLSVPQRNAVQDQIAETCRHRGWRLHAVNCRTNHAHIVVSAPDTRPKKIRADLKAWATRRLKERFDRQRDSWWAQRGSIRWLWDEEDLEETIRYVTQRQDRRPIRG